MTKVQSGRSMVEMLGVLAIIGVLSIGGIAGYTMAMNRHKANQTVDYATRLAIAAQTSGGYGIDDGVVQAADLGLDQYPIAEINGASVTRAGDTYTVAFTGDITGDSASGIQKAVKTVSGMTGNFDGSIEFDQSGIKKDKTSTNTPPAVNEG